MRWSVLVPVYLGAGNERAEGFARVLRAYRNVRSEDFEIVICCDGADARVPHMVREARLDRPVRILEQQRAGQSAATNRAAAHARGELLLFTAQDVLPHPDLLREHEGAQAAKPDAIVLGQLRYPEAIPVTPFMDFLVHGGPQFAYDRLRDGEPVPPYCLYAPNFSIRADLFRALGGFREDLPYACQDSELGMRFAAAGGTIVYHAAALGWHWHAQTLEAYLPRQRVAGRNTVRLLELYTRHRKLDWLREKVLEYYLPVAPRLPFYRERVRRFEAEPGGWRVAVEHSPVGPYEQEALWFLYDRITKCHFYEGVHEALEEREPGWVESHFEPWRIPGPEPIPVFRRSSPLVRTLEARAADAPSVAGGRA